MGRILKPETRPGASRIPPQLARIDPGVIPETVSLPDPFPLYRGGRLSGARIAYETYRGTYDIAKFYRDRVLPLRQVVSREVALRYNNGVLASEGLRVDLFKYLTDTRVRIGADAAALDARRDFFLATADLQAAHPHRRPLRDAGGPRKAHVDRVRPAPG